MYLDLTKIYFYFEFIDEKDFHYLNIINDQIYSKNELEELVFKELFDKKDFLLIPQIDRDEIVFNFLKTKNIKPLSRQKTAKTFFHSFHCYMEEHHLKSEWEDYEKKYLLKYASNFCAENHLKYTCKESIP